MAPAPAERPCSLFLLQKLGSVQNVEGLNLVRGSGLVMKIGADSCA
jgi:hypothetical protein